LVIGGQLRCDDFAGLVVESAREFDQPIERSRIAFQRLFT
jgi:hypothetical protein